MLAVFIDFTYIVPANDVKTNRLKNNIMKTIIFIILKVLEIAILPAVYFIICGLGWILRYIHCSELLADDITEFYLGYFCDGLLFLCLTIMIGAPIIFIVLFFPDWIKSNKKLSKKIYNKLFKK